MSPRSSLPRALTGLAACWVACSLGSCGEDAADGPPDIRLGRDACLECGMDIMEDRCSAAAIVAIGDHKEPALFDDIGCLLDWQAAPLEGALEGGTIVRRYVHDWTTKAWIAADDASFLMSETIRTPMASWIVAFTDKRAAEEIQAEHPGEILTWKELAGARNRWLDERGWLRE